MRQLKTMASLVVILGVIMMGTLNANAGIIVNDLKGKTDSNPCKVTKDDTTKVDHGIIVNDGIIVHDFVAAIFGWGVVDAFLGKTEVPTNCGIIVNDGIIVHD